MSNGWQQQSMTVGASPARLHLFLKATSIVSILVGLLCTIPAVYYPYLNLNPPKAHPGDLYFGDGTGYVIGALAGCLAVAAFAAGILIRSLRWRGSITGAIVVAALAPLIWLVVLAFATAFTSF